MSQTLPFDEIRFDRSVKLAHILNTLDDSDIGFFVEFDLIYPDKIKEKTRNFPFCPESKICLQDKITSYMKENKSNIYIQTKN